MLEFRYMSRFFRSLLFFGFVLFFFISAPLIILYTAGYRYNFTNGLVVQTGSLSLSTIPRNTKILLDHENTDYRTPNVLKRIIPGEYQVTLEKQGFFPWSGIIDVKKGMTTYLQNIILLRDSAAFLEESFSEYPIDVIPQEDRFLTITHGESYDELFLHQEQNSTLLVRQTSIQKEDLSFSPDHHYFFVSSEKPYLFSVDGTEIELPEEITSEGWQWLPDQPHTLTYLETPLFLTINPLSSTQTVESTFNGYLHIKGNSPYSNLIRTVNQQTDLIALLPEDEYEILFVNDPYIFIKNQKDQYFFLNTQDQNQPLLLQTHAKSYHWDEELQLLAYSDGYEINVYDPKTHRIEFITRQSTQIQNLLIHPNGQYLLFSSPSTIQAVELYQRSKYRQYLTVTETPNIQTFWLTKKGDQLFFLTESDDLTSSEIFSQRLTK